MKKLRAMMKGQPRLTQKQASTNLKRINTNPKQTNTNPKQTNTNPKQTSTNPKQTSTNPKQTNTNPKQTKTNMTQTNTNPKQTSTNPKQTSTNPKQTNTNPKKPRRNLIRTNMMGKWGKGTYYYELKSRRTERDLTRIREVELALPSALKKLLPIHDDDKEPLYNIKRSVHAGENYHKRLFRYELKSTKTRSQVAWDQGTTTASLQTEENANEQKSKPSIKTSKDTSNDKTENPEDGTTTEERKDESKPERTTRAALKRSSLRRREQGCCDGFDEATHCVLKSLYRMRQLDGCDHLEEEEKNALAQEDRGHHFRLTRRLSSAIIKEQLEAEREHEIANKVRHICEEGLQMEWMGEEKGRGVTTTRQFQKGDYVAEFKGQVIDAATASQREEAYRQDSGVGCFMFYFYHAGRRFCVDATEETGLLGRLVNHSRQANCKAQVIELEDGPHVIFLANRLILVGEEVTVDYGDRSAESLKHHPWLRHCGGRQVGNLCQDQQ